MEVTSENLTLLRKLLNERIPADGSEDDTRFTDVDLQELLEDSANIYYAASEGWIMKAGMYQEEMQDIRRYVTGTETYDVTRLMHRLEYALSLADYYGRLAEGSGAHSTKSGAVILSAYKPEV